MSRKVSQVEFDKMTRFSDEEWKLMWPCINADLVKFAEREGWNPNRVVGDGSRMSPGNLRVELSWGVGADMTVNAKELYQETVFLETDEKVGLTFTKVEVSFNWSGTSRSVSDALASVDLYEKLVRFGALIEAKYARKQYWTKHNVK